MALKLIKEAIVGDYHFVSSTDYLVVTKGGEELVHLTSEEGHDVVEWLVTEGLFADPRLITKDTSGPAEHYKEFKTPIKPQKQEPKRPEVDPYENRKAKVSEKAAPYFEALGDPFLAQNAPVRSNDGKQAILGMETTDLGEAALKAGTPIIRK